MGTENHRRDDTASKDRTNTSGLEAVLIGSGSATPDPVRANPSIAVVIDGEILLFDCGERATVNITEAGINPIDIDHLLFSHLHWDHIADFNYFAMTTWNCGKSDVLEIHGPPGTEEMVDHMLQAHHVDVSFVEQFVEGLPDHITDAPEKSFEYDVQELEEGLILEMDSYTVTAKQVEHINLIGPEFERSSWGFRIDTDYGSVAISGDTQACDEMIELADGVDVLFHEAAFLDEIIEERDMSGHSGPSQAGYVAEQADVGKLVLTHLGRYDSNPAAVEMASMYYGERRGPEVWSKILGDAMSEFSGPVVIGEDAMSVDV